MTAETSDELKAQLYTLYRAKDYCLLNGLKTVQYTTINELFKMALLAISEEKKFLEYLGSDEWPIQMSTIKENLLKSTVLDGEIEGNKGNETTILTSLRSALLSIDPNLVKKCDDALKLKFENNPLTDVRPTDQVDEPDNNPDNQQSPNNVDNSDTDSGQLSKTELENMELKKNLERLKSHDIECVNMDWKKFVTTVWSANDGQRADTIVTEPPPISSRSFLGPEVSYGSRKVEQELSEEDVLSMPVLSKRLLKPGGYVVLIIKFEAFGEWFQSFRKAGYVVMPYPYVFAYQPHTIQDRNPLYFPQPGADYGLLAYHPNNDETDTGFRPNFKSVFSDVGSRAKRHLSIMTDIPAPKSKLCRGNTR